MLYVTSNKPGNDNSLLKSRGCVLEQLRNGDIFAAHVLLLLQHGGYRVWRAGGDVHCQITREVEEVILLGYRPGLGTELDQDTDATHMTVTLNEAIWRVH
jgi:hypothetical protein